VKASDILGFDDLKTKVVNVKWWDCEVTVRELDFEQTMKATAMFKGVDDDNPTVLADDLAQVVAWGVVDTDTGERVFSDDDVPALAKKSAKALMFLYSEILAVSTVSQEEAVKN
jgi:hypothetical protein